MTDTQERTATRTYRHKHGTVTVTARPEGWTITGDYSVWEGSGKAPAFAAEISRCPCDPEHPDAATYAGPRREPCGCTRASHLGGRFCHGWHLPRVERLAEDVAKTYGRRQA